MSDVDKPTRQQLLEAVEVMEQTRSKLSETYYLLGFKHGDPEMELFKGYYREAKENLIALINLLCEAGSAVGE